MGLFSKLKQAMNVVTGGAAQVSLEWTPPAVTPGQPIHVKVSARSTGSEVKSDGIFVDVFGRETFLAPAEPPRVEPQPKSPAELDYPPEVEKKAGEPETDTKTIFRESFRLCEAFVLGADHTRQVEGQFTLPAHLPASRDGDLDLIYRIRGRMEAFGNDPDSGYKELRVISAPATNASGPTGEVEI